MNRIDKTFKELKKSKKKAFIAFITAGYPSIKTTEQLIYAFTRIGVDIIELGVPFSDPLADGPVIQEASSFALRKNTDLRGILNLVKKARKLTEIPICLMTYYNPIFCFGEAKFARQAKASGVDGVIIPDLPPDEGMPFIKLCNKNGLEVVCFIAPTTPVERVKYIAKIGRGFIYYVSLTGVTGPRAKLAQDIKTNIKLIKRFAKKPVCVGFGVSSRKQIEELKKSADGVIVGSAIVRKIKENIGRQDLVERVTAYVDMLKR